MRSVVTIPTGAVADSASTRKGSALSEPDREEQPADGKENRTVLYPRIGGMKRIVITTGEDHRLVTGKPVRERTHRNRSGEMPHPMVRPCGRKSPDIIGFADISLPRRGTPPGAIHRRMLAGARGKGRTGHETSGQRSHATTGARARQIVAAPERPARQPKPAPFPTVEDGRDPAASAARFRKDRCQCPSGGKARGEEFLKQSALPRRRQHGGRSVDTDQRPAPEIFARVAETSHHRRSRTPRPTAGHRQAPDGQAQATGADRGSANKVSGSGRSVRPRLLARDCSTHPADAIAPRQRAAHSAPPLHE